MAAAGLLSRLSVFRALGIRYSSGFQSTYSLDKLYPDGTNRTTEVKQQNLIDIPVDRLTISYCKSSGPGGQNVNKVNTKAEIRFHVSSADWIPEDVREKISLQNKNRINRNGELIVASQVSRHQMRNLADCLEKIRTMISEANQKPKPVSEKHVQRRQARLESMNRERLQQKKIHSSIKQTRRVSFE